MGNYMFTAASDCYGVWVRNKETNQYVEALALTHYTEGDPDTLTDALGIFRRETNMYALRRAYVDAKVLYLYCGSRRLARAELQDQGNLLELSFVDAATLQKYRNAKEVLAPTPDGAQWPLAQDGFNAAFEAARMDDDGYTIRHQRCEKL